MRGPKLSLSKAFFEKADDRSFLAAVDKIEPKKLSNGMWGKLYAIFANVRQERKSNICIYTGEHYEYDTTNRTFWPVVGDIGMTIGNQLRAKEDA